MEYGDQRALCRRNEEATGVLPTRERRKREHVGGSATAWGNRLIFSEDVARDARC